MAIVRDNYTIDDQEILKFKDGITETGVINSEDQLLFTQVVFNDITIISSQAFQHCRRLTNIIISDGITSIGASAFYGCTGLKSVKIGSGVKNINNSAFRGCDSLTNIIVDPMNSIYDSREECNGVINKSTNELIIGCRNTTIPNSVTNIGDYAFYDCYTLTSMIIPNGVTEIGENAFGECTRLANVTIGSGVKKINNSAFFYCISLISLTIPSNVESIGDSAFGHCKSLTDVAISYNVTNIGNSAFSGCTRLTSVTIPDSVTSLGDAAFEGCTSLTDVVIENSAIKIGVYAFNGCSKIKNLTIPVSVEINNKNTFGQCTNIERIILTRGTGTMVNYGGENAPPYQATPWYISRKNIKEIIIEEGVKNIGDYAFLNCAEIVNVIMSDSIVDADEGAYIKVPDSITSIGKGAFQGCNSIVNMEIPDGVVNIGKIAFGTCTSLTNITIPSGITVINEDTFHSCSSLISITIPNGVTSIGIGAFGSCDSLTDIVIPDSVKDIGSAAFASCYNLVNITIPNGIVTINERTFDNCTNLANIIIPDSVVSIGRSAFYECTGLTNIIIPSNVTNISEYAFAYCTGINNIEIPDNVKTIGDHAFENIFNIIYHGSAAGSPWGARYINAFMEGFLVYSNESKVELIDCNEEATGQITIPDTTSSIIEEVFKNCFKITEIIIPDSVLSIGKYCFYNCTSLLSVQLSNNLTEIQDFTFFNCSGLTSIIIPNKVETIGGNAFYGCSQLFKVNLGNGLKEIKESAFEGCMGLEEVTVPNSVMTIRRRAFSSCQNLKKLTIPCNIEYDNNNWDPKGLYSFEDCLNIESVILTKGSGDTAGIMPDYGENYKYTPWYVSRKNIINIQITSDIIKISKGAFKGCNSLTRITIPYVGLEGYSKNENSVFGAIFGYETLEIGEKYPLRDPNTKEEIDPQSYASHVILNKDDENDFIIKYEYTGEENFFYYYIPSSLREITILPGPYFIPSHGFYNCWNLEAITIPNTILTIGRSAFGGHNALKKVLINDLSAWCQIEYDISSKDNSALVLSRAGNLYYKGMVLTDLTIPSDVEKINNYAFCGCKSLINITIPANVTTIGRESFAGCSNLSTLSIESGINFIADGAFSGCNNLKKINISDIISWCSINFQGDANGSSANPLYNGASLYVDGNKITKLQIPSEVIEIKDYVFNYFTDLTDLSLGTNTQKIGQCAFANCPNLQNVSMGTRITNIGANAFGNCTKLNSEEGKISISDIKYWCQIDFSVSEGSSFDANPINLVKNLFITNNNKYAIEHDDEGVYHLNIPEGIERLGKGVFVNCQQIKTITFPSTLKQIDSYAFYGCSGLVKIDIPKNVESISSTAFSYCSALGDNYQGVSQGIPFNRPGGITVDVQNQNYYSRIGSIEYNAIIEKSPTGENDILILGCKKTSIPDRVTAIGIFAFMGCEGLTSIDLSNTNIVNIEGDAFKGCIKLETIYFPKRVVNISGEAFLDCLSLNKIYIKNLNIWASMNFDSETSNPLNISPDSKLYLETASGYTLVEDLIITGDAIDGAKAIININKYTFSGCSSIKTVTIGKASSGSGVQVICNNAFIGCKNLKSVVIKNSVTYIQDRAFANCEQLDEITLPDSIESVGIGVFNNTAYYYDESNWVNINNQYYYGINPNELVVLYINTILLETKTVKDIGNLLKGDYTIKKDTTLIADGAFSNCFGLTGITFLDSLKYIGVKAFSQCTGLTSVVIPDNVEKLGREEKANYGDKIDSGVFANCSNLESVIISKQLNEICNKNFANCVSLKTFKSSEDTEVSDNVIFIPQNIKIIREQAFTNCSGIETLIFSSGVETTEREAFSRCDKLTHINIPETLTTVGKSCFYKCEGLVNIQLNNTTTVLDESCFSRCSGLTEISISCASIKEEAFSYCENLAKATILNGSLGKHIFGKCSLLKYLSIPYLPANLGQLFFETGIGGTLQRETSVKNRGETITTYYYYDIPASLTDIVLLKAVSLPSDAFRNCVNLTNITINNNYTIGDTMFIGPRSFKNCIGITHLTIPDNCTELGKQAFSSCKNLTKLTCYNNLLKIGEGAFEYCFNLENLLIPSTVTEIGAEAFSFCTKLNGIIFDDNYISNESSQDFIDGVKIINSKLKNINNGAFKHCMGLKNFIVPDTVERLGSEAFAYCSNLENITIGISKLRSILEIEKNVNLKYIGARAFLNTLLCSKEYNYKGCQIINYQYSSKYGNYIYNEQETQMFDGDLEVCQSGLHYCTNLFDIFNYYSGEINGEGIHLTYNYDGEKDVIETNGVEAVAVFSCDVGVNKKEHNIDSKIVTDQIQPIRKLTRGEIIYLLNGNLYADIYQYVDYTEDFSNGLIGNKVAQIAATYKYHEVKESDYRFENNSIFNKDEDSEKYYVRNSDGNIVMDCSTFVGLVLRGIPYENSPYANNSSSWYPEDIIYSYGDNGWEYKELDEQPIGEYTDIGIYGSSSLTTSADLARFFYAISDKQGHKYGSVIYATRHVTFNSDELQEDYVLSVPTSFTTVTIIQIIVNGETITDYTFSETSKTIHFSTPLTKNSKVTIIFTDEALSWDGQNAIYKDKNLESYLQPGDLIFWSKPISSQEQKKRYRNISHVAIVSEDIGKYYQVTSTTNELEDKGDNYDKIIKNGLISYLPFNEDRVKNIDLIIRPKYANRATYEIPLNKNLLSYPPTWGTSLSINYPKYSEYGYYYNWQTIENKKYMLQGYKTQGQNPSSLYIKGYPDNNNDDLILTKGTYLVNGLGEVEEDSVGEASAQSFSVLKTKRATLKASSANANYNGLVKVDGEWGYYKNGVLDTSFEGMAPNAYNWWYIKNGRIDTTYTGMAQNQYTWWYIKNGELDRTYTGMEYGPGGWMYVSYGQLDTNYTGMAKNPYGWWYIKNGRLDRTYTGMEYGPEGWMYAKNGQFDTSYNGMATNMWGTWKMKNGRIDLTYKQSKNYLIYPTKVMNISQTYNATYSHKPHTTGNIKDYPIDEPCGDQGRSYFYCPCDEVKITRIYGVGNSGTNTIWMQSTSKVYFADGTNDYVTILVIHPNDDTLKGISVGQRFKRKQQMFLEGKDGNASGNHFHISVGKGTPKGNGWAKNSNGKWVLTTSSGSCKPENAFYIDTSFTTVKNKAGLSFKNLPSDTTSYYVVKHYLMNLDGSTYTLKDTNTHKETINASVTISSVKNTYAGFTYQGGKGATAASASKPSSFDTTTTVLANAQRVINIYYSRNKYTLTLRKDTGNSSAHLLSSSKNSRTFVLVGDSYGVPYQSGGKGWINSFKSILPANWKVVAAQAGAGVGLQENMSSSGEGILTQDLFELQPGNTYTYTQNRFYSSKMINQQLSDAKIDPNSITDIVILGGRNDMYHLNTSSSSDIISSHATACKNLNAWLKTKYPKARVFWGMIGWGVDMSNDDICKLNYVLQGWIQGCNQSDNGYYLNNIECELRKDNSLFGTNAPGGTPTTNTHPVSTGCDKVAELTKNLINYWGDFYYYSSILVQADLIPGATWNKWLEDSKDYSSAQITRISNFKEKTTLNASTKIVDYSITYNLNGGAVSQKNPATYNFITSDIILNNPTRDGCTFTGWTGTGLKSATRSVVIPKGSMGNRTYTANWRLNQAGATETTYTVNYYQEKIGGGYTLRETFIDFGIVGQVITISNLKKSYKGFTYIPNSPSTVAIQNDNKTIINLYYARNTYDLVLNKGTGISSVSGAGTYYYEESVKIDAVIQSGYLWDAWKTETGVYSQSKSLVIQMSDCALTLTASATKDPYRPEEPDPEPDPGPSIDYSNFNLQVRNYKNENIASLDKDYPDRVICYKGHPSIFTVSNEDRYKVLFYIGEEAISFNKDVIEPQIMKISDDIYTQDQADDFLNYYI